MSYIRWFQDIGTPELAQVGGKGANLGELTRAGLPVPPGFCIATNAYQDFLKATQLDRSIEDILADINLGDLDDVKIKSAQIRNLILSQPIPPDVAKEVIDGYSAVLQQYSGEGLKEIPLAVRSSATAEDQANASFAGQLETYLNIRGEAALLDHIKKCWTSLWTDRVVSYIARQGLDHRLVSMCVIVQEMIPSEVSGVLFTANPVTGNCDEAVLNASWGLGEAIVSGVVSPDTFTVCKTDGQIVSREISSKDIMISYSLLGGTEEIPISEENRLSPALSDLQIKDLVELGNRIEAYYGKPQDIEWGFYHGKWYLLQSRPITTLTPQIRQEYPKGEFNRSMFIEIFPDPISPVFLSVIEQLFKGMLDFAFRSWGFEPPEDIQAIGVFYNQAYFNRDYIAAAYQSLPPGIREQVIASSLNPFSDQQGTIELELSSSFMRMVFEIFRIMVRFPKQLPGLLGDYHEEIAEAESYPFETAKDVDIAALIRRVPYEYASKLLNYDFLMISVIKWTYRLLGSILKRYYGADTDEVVAKLISGVTGNVTMETNKRIWDLAQLAKSSPEVCKILRDYPYMDSRSLLQDYPEGRAFLKSLDRFLVEYGHREIRMDIVDPTWRDDPEPVIAFIRSYLDADEEQSPHQQQERLIKEREQLTSFVLNDIERGLVGRLLVAPAFRWILQQTQIHTRERDTMHFEMTRIFPPLRHMLLELGERWTKAGVLDQDEDIFFLTMEEIQETAENPRRMQETAQARKEEYTINQSRPCPVIIRNGEEIYSKYVESGVHNGSSLRGVPGSPGKAVGITRIISKPEEFSRLQKGEILVAPITTPVWTPLFAIAGGLVTEVGGILSHGAIVAREYGIPAVMSVPGATKLMVDGQQVTVDGNKGLIHLEMEV